MCRTGTAHLCCQYCTVILYSVQYRKIQCYGSGFDFSGLAWILAFMGDTISTFLVSVGPYVLLVSLMLHFLVHACAF
jgi:apolipoprotein N-acyltransferase